MGISTTDVLSAQGTTSESSRKLPFRTNAVEKKLQCELAKLQSKYPQADIEVWCEDEQRLGLQPKARRVWTELGGQPIANVKT